MFVFLDFVKSRFVILRFCSMLFYCIFGWTEQNRLLYRGLCYMEVL